MNVRGGNRYLIFFFGPVRPASRPRRLRRRDRSPGTRPAYITTGRRLDTSPISPSPAIQSGTRSPPRPPSSARVAVQPRPTAAHRRAANSDNTRQQMARRPVAYAVALLTVALASVYAMPEGKFSVCVCVFVCWTCVAPRSPPPLTGLSFDVELTPSKTNVYAP